MLAQENKDVRIGASGPEAWSGDDRGLQSQVLFSLQDAASHENWGDELRKAVPELWRQAIREGGESLALEETFFSFIEPATMNAYREAFDKLTGTRQLIDLDSIECEIAKKKLGGERLERQRTVAE